MARSCRTCTLASVVILSFAFLGADQVWSEKVEQGATTIAQKAPAKSVSQDALKAYLEQLHRTLQNSRIDPRSRSTGTVLISFTVAPSGQLLSRTVKESSGSKLLDDAAMAALDRAAPFPPMPENVAQRPLEVQVPFKFVTR